MSDVMFIIIIIAEFLVWVILPAVLLIWLQVRLSHHESRWPGLILPGLHLLLAIGMVIGIGMMLLNPRAAVELNDKPSLVEGDVGDQETNGGSIGVIGIADSPTAIFVARAMDGFLGLTPVFLIFNIPTAIDLAIYAAFRRKRADVDKSRIQDL